MNGVTWYVHAVLNRLYQESEKPITHKLIDQVMRELVEEQAPVFQNYYNEAQSKPDGLKNYAVFDAKKVHILKVEHIEVKLKGSKYVLVEGSKKEVKI